MTEIHATPGGQQAVRYQVVESQLQASREHVDQVAVVGRSNDGVHVVMTPAAAEALAKILVQHYTAHQHKQLPELDDFDASFWTHLSVDILVAKAHALAASQLKQDVVYATRIDPSTSGYMRPKMRRGLELVEL